MKTTILFLTFMLFFCIHATMAQDKAGKPGTKTPAKTTGKRVKKTAKIQYGMASFYHSKFQGRKTSSGEKYDQDKMTAAHNGLPMNTWIRVTNIRNGRTVVVKINPNDGTEQTKQLRKRIYFPERHGLFQL
ncbi:MAG: septal ring lytic transglycosylase RlpA family protein, partial [Chitinophagaceae bacterium]